jgi:hypothetical protein
MHLNTPGFAMAVVDAFEEMMKRKGEPNKRAFIRP